MIYTFIDDQATFVIKNPHPYHLYFPLTDARGRLLASISPNLSGDIKRDNNHFLTLPASIEDTRSSPLCTREFFLRAGTKTIRLSRPYRDSLQAGLLYHAVTKKIGSLCIEVLNFIPHDSPVEVMRITVRNSGIRPVSIVPTSCIPLFGRTEKNLRDHRHVSSLLNRIRLEKYGIVLTPTMRFDEQGHTINKTRYFVYGYEGRGRAPVGQFPTLDYFYGGGDIFSPDAVEKDLPPVKKHLPEFDGKEALAGLRFRRRMLKPGSEQTYTLLLGIADSEADIAKAFKALRTPAQVARALEETKRYWQDYRKGLQFDFQDRQRNGWLRWVTVQPTLRKLFGCSFLPHFDYGKGGRGWRDLWQDALALLLTEPGKAKAIITKSFAGIRLDGSNATIIAQDGSFLADRNRINRVWMDHGIWPYLTTRSFIDRTGDVGILLKETTYFRDHQLCRAHAVDASFSQPDFLQRDTAGCLVGGSILEHLLVQHLVQFFNVGKHNIIRLENADWNDGLDMAADQGESAAFSFMYAHNLGGLSELLEVLKEKHATISLAKELTLLLDRLTKPIDYSDYRKKQKLLARYFDLAAHPCGKKVEVAVDGLIRDLEAKYQHMHYWLGKNAWLSEGFFNGYYDNKARRAEGKINGTVRMMLASQVFAIMSGIASPVQIKSIWKKAAQYLKDARFGGFHLNTDFKSVQMDLGRAFGFSYGDKENGAFFSHMNVMFANSLYRRNFIREGAFVLESLYRMATHDRAQIGPGIPEYFNNQGRGLYLYLTGSASWYVHTLVEEALGIKFTLGNLVLEPKLVADPHMEKKIKVVFALGKKNVTIVYTIDPAACANKRLCLRSVSCKGKPVACNQGSCLIKPAWLEGSSPVITLALG